MCLYDCKLVPDFYFSDDDLKLTNVLFKYMCLQENVKGINTSTR